MKSRKILFVIPSMQQGGAERVVSVLANHWAMQGQKVFILSFDNAPSYFTLHKSIVINSLHSAKRSFGAFGFLVNNFLRTKNYFIRLKKIKPDIIISFTDNANVYCVLYNYILNKPLIITQRTNPYFHTLPAIIGWLPKHIYKRAHAIVVQTTQTLQIYDELKVPLPQKKRVIYNPLPATVFSDTYRGERKKIILAVGRLYNRNKHFDKLIDMFNSINNEQWELHIAGEGPDLKMLSDKILQLGLSKKVLLLGSISELATLYQSAKIFVLTSEFEGFPNALCEAMANGCACISYNCATGPSEIINHQKNGILVETGNEMEFKKQLSGLMNDETKILQFSNEAIKIRAVLEEAKIMQQWNELIESVLQK